MFSKNKNSSSVFLSRDKSSGTNGPMNRHSVEVAKPPKRDLPNSNDVKRKNMHKDRLIFLTPQEHSSQNPDQIFISVAMEKKRFFGRFKQNKADTEMVSIGFGYPQRRNTGTGNMNPNSRHNRLSTTSLTVTNIAGDTSPQGGESLLQGWYRGVCRAFKRPDNKQFRQAESQPDLFTQQIKRYSIEQEFDIMAYANKEWATTKPNAIRMKNGYKRVQSIGYLFIRRVRGDNYCALRSILFQILTLSDISKTVLAIFPTLNKAIERLDYVSGQHGNCVKNWSFGQNTKLRAGKKNPMIDLRECIEAFYDICEKLKLKSHEARRKIVVDQLNEQSAGVFQLDAKLMEFVKFLMFSQAVDLYQKQDQGKEIPDWFLFLTLRDNSSSLQEFFEYHLNRVGDTLGLEQIEMFLLGKALNVRIQVFRLKCIGEQDFETLYPPKGDSSLPNTAVTLPLSAEDDRHYNVVY
ncbi:Ubiquitin thioesterase otulin [Oopsacas minuta]|uniref:Ubiquitin thioesterase otulin n=1 Tax=Oopsacas minuta TaxID=111878 RepID=A0AAV7JKY6_9METZ|nr:Ubiquitin thioesterase otulin [Oopsacas minuta]